MPPASDSLLPQLLATIFLIGMIAAGIWYVTSPAVLFAVAVSDGVPQATRGKVTPAFLAVVREVCERNNIRVATIRGIAAGKRIALRFSTELPAAAQQQLRNWWANSGWSAR